MNPNANYFILLWCIKAVKLDNEVIILQRNVPTIDLCRKKVYIYYQTCQISDLKSLKRRKEKTKKKYFCLHFRQFWLTGLAGNGNCYKSRVKCYIGDGFGFGYRYNVV